MLPSPPPPPVCLCFLLIGREVGGDPPVSSAQVGDIVRRWSRREEEKDGRAEEDEDDRSVGSGSERARSRETERERCLWYSFSIYMKDWWSETTQPYVE